MVNTAPPAYAWDWFSRQKLLWREARARLVTAPSTASAPYADASSRTEVVDQLRSDYETVPLVRETVDRVVAEVAFLDRLDVPFEQLGVRLPPRGMRWWWQALTGEVVGAPPSRADLRAIADERARQQLTLEDVLEGYGDGPR